MFTFKRIEKEFTNCFIYLICGYYNNAFSAPHVAISGWHAALGRGEIECNWSSFTNTGIDEEE
jgi:hypothetical protein